VVAQQQGEGLAEILMGLRAATVRSEDVLVMYPNLEEPDHSDWWAQEQTRWLSA
jgi:hypothetical protein